MKKGEKRKIHVRMKITGCRKEDKERRRRRRRGVKVDGDDVTDLDCVTTGSIRPSCSVTQTQTS